MKKENEDFGHPVTDRRKWHDTLDRAIGNLLSKGLIEPAKR